MNLNKMSKKSNMVGDPFAGVMGSGGGSQNQGGAGSLDLFGNSGGSNMP